MGKKINLDSLIQKYGILPMINKIILPDSKIPKPLTLEFVRGQIDGDGSFNVSFRTERRRVNVNFSVVHELSSISAAIPIGRRRFKFIF